MRPEVNMTLADHPVPALAPRRFNRREYDRMAEMGLFDNERVELFNGEILPMAPQNNPHALTVAAFDGWLHRNLGPEFTIRCQLPFIVNDNSKPEPDFAVIKGRSSTQSGHPETALLVIEISDSSYPRDIQKSDAYASADVSEYWIVNLAEKRLEVFRDPAHDRASKFGKRYAGGEHRRLEDPVACQSLPLPPIILRDLIPTAAL
jgi:Uma2 family endonuclease